MYTDFKGFYFQQLKTYDLNGGRTVSLSIIFFKCQFVAQPYVKLK